MKKRITSALKILLALLAIPAACTLLQAQTAGVPVEVVHADRISLKKVNDSTNLTILEGNVVMKQGKTTFACNRCIRNERERTFEAWGNVHIRDADTTDIYADHLRYLSDKQLAFLNGNVRLTDGIATITTPAAEYNMATNIATYKHGGKVVNKKTVITSREANYYTDIRDVIFMKDVKVNDPAYNIVTDSLLYNTENRIARFKTYTVIRDSANRRITTRQGYYNLATGDAEFGQRSMVNDDNKSTVIADSLILSEEFAQAIGQAVVVDSIRKTIIIADLIYQNRFTDAVLATKNPLLIIRQDNDSIYVTADTLFSARLTDLYDSAALVPGDSIQRHTVAIAPDLDSAQNAPPPGFTQGSQPVSPTDSLQKPPAEKQQMPPTPATEITEPAPKQPITPADRPPAAAAMRTMPADSAGRAARPASVKKKNNDNDSTNRYFEAFHNVKIFSDSMQAVSDSLFYSFKDSTFRLYKDPVVWSDGNQITGDTLLMHTKNKQPAHFEAIGHGFMINHLEQQVFNQVKSSRIDGYFTNGNLDSVRANGSSEAIYYVLDNDSAYVGVNQSTSDMIDAYLREKQLKKVVLRGQPKGIFYPIRQKSSGEMQLQGFHWREAERPKSKYDLLQ